MDKSKLVKPSRKPTGSLNRIYGWAPDVPDARDFQRRKLVAHAGALPDTLDLRTSGYMPPVYNQLTLGSCTANAIGSAHQFAQNKQGEKSFIPSRLMLYYLERVMEGTVREDAGAQIRDGFKVIAQSGVAPESLWPYVVKQFATKPPAAAYKEALKHLAMKYESVEQSELGYKDAICAGFPVVLGFTVYSSFESAAVAANGIMPMPNLKTEQVLGGHAVKGVGFTNDLTKVHSQGAKLKLPAWAKKIVWWLIVKNSWDTTWGDGGYFYMPADYFLNGNLSDDAWTCELVE